MAVSGMPEDRSAYRTQPCGCETVWLAGTPSQGPSRMVVKRCDEHAEGER